MQNKPNFMKNSVFVTYDKSNGYENAPPIFGPKIPKPISTSVQMNLTLCFTMNYEPRTMNYPGKNKPKQTQFKPNFKVEAERRSLWVSFSEFPSQGPIYNEPGFEM